MDDLKWSDKLPNCVGYWWWRDVGSTNPPHIYSIVAKGKKLFIHMGGCSTSLGFIGGEWAGPIMPPE